MLTDEHAFTLELAERTLALDPESYTGLYASAQALSELGRAEQALQVLLALRAAHPNEHNAYEKLALLSAANNQLDEALELADQAVQLGPYCPFAWAARGFVYFVLDQPVEALADLQMAWNRGNSQRRHKSPIYWWIMAELQEDEKLASEMRQAALDQADIELDQRMIALVEGRLVEKG
jgi:predicted Zn-dependent protease